MRPKSPVLSRYVVMQRSSIVKAILGIAIGVLIGYLVWRVFPEYFTAQEDPRSRAHLSKIAAELNRSVPVMIDAETELMPTEGVEGMLIYNYRLISYSAAQIDSKRFAAGAKQRVVQGACNTPEIRNNLLPQRATLRPYTTHYQ